jgi:hypothetical protein
LLVRGSLVQKPLGEPAVGIDSPIAKKGPIAPNPLDRAWITIHDQHGFLIMRCLREDSTKGIGHKGTTPESNALTVGPLERLVSDAIHGNHEDAIRNRVGALNRLPRLHLRLIDGLALVELSTDRRRVEKEFRAGECGRPRRLGKPLIPTDQHTEPPGFGLMGHEAEISRREMEFLVVERIVGDMHLPIATGDFSSAVQDDRRVVVEARGTTLEE